MARQLVAELCGTALLLLAIVGSGVTASADGAESAQLFQHAVVVGATLAALIAAFGAVSGAHFNPVVTLVDALHGGLGRRAATGYVAAQLAGALSGVVLANLLFDLQPIALSTTDRGGAALALSEAVATFGLVVVIFGVVRAGRPGAVAATVGAWIAGAIYFTSSASFANPAVTLARQLTDTYTGIAPAAVPGFLLAQLLGAVAAGILVRWLFHPEDMADEVLLPHPDPEEVDLPPWPTR